MRAGMARVVTRSTAWVAASFGAAGLDAAARELVAALLERVQRVTERVAAVRESVPQLQSIPHSDAAAARAATVDTSGATGANAYDGEAAAADAGELGDVAREVHRIGWLFGVCASGFGADTLVERVERDGLDDVLAWAGDAVRRSGRELVVCGACELQLCAPIRVAPNVAFTLALAAVCAASTRPRGLSTRIEFVVETSRALVRFDTCCDDALTARWVALGGTFVHERGTSVWALPPNWLSFGARRAR